MLKGIVSRSKNCRQIYPTLKVGYKKVLLSASGSWQLLNIDLNLVVYKGYYPHLDEFVVTNDYKNKEVFIDRSCKLATNLLLLRPKWR